MEDLKIEEIRRQLEDISLKPRKDTGAAEGQNFSQVFSDAIEKINDDQKASKQAIRDYMSGENTNLHETLLSLEKADISFKMMMQVRSKLVSAYQEIMRTQV